MTTRITEKMLYNQSGESIARVRENLTKSQEEATTQKRINRPSDDPASAMHVSLLNSSNKRSEKVHANLEYMNSFLNVTEASLNELNEVLTRAKELAVQENSTSNQEPGSRLGTAAEVQQLLMRVVQSGNSRLGDRYIFGGHQSDRPPFDADGNYYGDGGVTEMEFANGGRLAINIPGSQVFFGIKDLAPEAQQIRDDVQKNGQPTLEGSVRGPASLEAPKNSDPKTVLPSPTPTKVNIYQVIKDFHEGLLTNDKGKLQGTLEAVDEAMKQVIANRTLIGARQNMLEMGLRSLDQEAGSNKQIISNLEDSDAVKVFSDLARNENALKVAMETNSKLISPSLLQFLK